MSQSEQIRKFYEKLIHSSLRQLQLQDAIYYAEQLYLHYDTDINTILTDMYLDAKKSHEHQNIYKNNLQHSASTLMTDPAENNFFKNTLGISGLYWLSHCYWIQAKYESVYNLLSTPLQFIIENYYKNISADESILPQPPHAHNITSKKGCYDNCTINRILSSTLWIYANSCFKISKFYEAEKVVFHLKNQYKPKSKENSTSAITCDIELYPVPELESIYYLLGQICWKTNRHNISAEYYNLALVENPFCISAWRSLCQLRAGKESLDRLEKSFGAVKIKTKKKIRAGINTKIKKNSVSKKSPKITTKTVISSAFRTFAKPSFNKKRLKPLNQRNLTRIREILGDKTTKIPPNTSNKILESPGSVKKEKKRRIEAVPEQNSTLSINEDPMPLDDNRNYSNASTLDMDLSFVDYIVDINVKLCKIYMCSVEHVITEASTLYKEIKNTPVGGGHDCVLAMASVYHEYGDYEKAIELFNKISKSTFINQKGLDLYSSLLWQIKNKAEIVQLYWQVKSIEATKTVELYIIAANAYSLDKRHDLAVVMLYYALQVFESGVVFEKIENIDQDVDLRIKFQTELQIDADVLADSVLGYTSKVIAKCQDLESLKQVGYIYTLLGYEFTNYGTLDYAIRAFTASIRIYKYGYNPYYGIGVIYMRSEKLDLANYYLEQAYRLNSGNPMVNCCLGMIFEKQKYYISSYQYYKRAIIKAEPWVHTQFSTQVDSNGFVSFVLFKIANLYFKQGSFSRCQKILMKLLKTQTKERARFGIQNEEILFLLGQTLANMGKPAAAKMCLEESIADYKQSGMDTELQMFVRNVKMAITGLSTDTKTVVVGNGDSMNQHRKHVEQLTAQVINTVFT
ncbi:hypothetical protein BB561_001722 [Smittium simulii]|uniref:Cdc23 domain-containing protein n=1 Tax=Smittium simulii TaxID=133385 RepID=A0A2T9YTD4_9FUNG|nr:hypothetical protein BB561_001722 [Smittium simulii]